MNGSKYTWRSRLFSPGRLKVTPTISASSFAPQQTTSPPERHPLYAQREALGRRVGAERASWMLRTRQLDVFPNLQIGSSAAIQMRVIRPLAPDLTEVNT